MAQTTTNSQVIKATPEKVYNAFINPEALETWQVPRDMKAKVHHFDLKVGGGYQMSLFYPDNEKRMKGKTNEKEDRYRSRFIELVQNRKIVQAIQFNTTNPDFLEEMIMEVRFNPVEHGTEVTLLFKNIPIGIKPEDNEEGTKSSLEKLANYLENKK